MTLTERKDTLVGSYAPDFELPGIDDQVHHLSRYLETQRAVGVIFMCNHCPYVRSYLDRLKQIQTEFQEQSFTLIGINANDANQYPEDSFENMKTFAASRELNFPYLWDSTQDVAHSFSAQMTPEVFLIDNEGIVQYNGAIDDHPQSPESVQVQYLREAVANLLKGEAVPQTSTQTIGCSLKWRQ